MGSSYKKIVVGVCVSTILAACVGIFWLLRVQKRHDEGERVVVFNNSEAPMSISIGEDHLLLAPRETWRSGYFGEDNLHIKLGSDSFNIETHLDGSCILIPTKQAHFTIVNPVGAFANLNSGRMSGVSSVVGHFPPARTIRVEGTQWVLSPYEKLPESTAGGIPYKAIATSAETSPQKTEKWLKQMDQTFWSSAE